MTYAIRWWDKDGKQYESESETPDFQVPLEARRFAVGLKDHGQFKVRPHQARASE